MSYQSAMREPLLSFEQERAAISGWQDRGDRAALEVLLRSHARQAWSHAARFTDNPVHLEDLASEGLMGLLRAADSFDRAQDVRFATYAAWWVRNAVSSALSRIKAVIDIPARTFLDAQTGNLSENDLFVMQLATRGTVALDPHPSGDAGDLDPVLVSSEPDPEEHVSQQSQRRLLMRFIEDALARMEPEEVAVIRRRRLSPEPEPLAEIARDLGITQDRLRQVERRAMMRLRRVLIDCGFSRNVLP
ncbi:sigma-70 family RNA polymerase sigma factor [Salipiger bermudensis]|uniref:sigma-70 family RNA polymerase sigma factor n=1 Tax=Salipiger bermudensis TaxID=344736 RepID=UPI0021BD72B4|nr:sigma-70 family RNA polymerase sigma factor [Salipiger bermudensis]